MAQWPVQACIMVNKDDFVRCYRLRRGENMKFSEMLIMEAVFSHSMLLVRHVIVLVQQTWAVDDALSKEFIII